MWGTGLMIGGMSFGLQAGINGIQNGIQQFNKSAQKIAEQGIQQDGTYLANYAEEAVNMLEAKNQVAASAKTVKAYDDIMGTLIDVTV